MPIAQFFTLLFCNLIWSASYSASKHLMARFHPLEISFFRILCAFIVMLILAFRHGRDSKILRLGKDLSWADSRIAAIGVITFFFSPLLSMNGLKLSRAVDGALTIAMEPLVTIVVAAIVLRERLKSYQLFSLAMAILGTLVLSDVSLSNYNIFTDGRLLGNFLMIASVACEAGFSILSKPALKRRDPIMLMTMAVGVATLCIFGYNMAVDGPSRLAGLRPFFQQGTSFDYLLVFYLGAGGTVLGYLFWLMSLKTIPVSVMALTLYVQPVLGTVWGWLFLNEQVTATTIMGGALIFLALAIGAMPPSEWKRIRRKLMI